MPTVSAEDAETNRVPRAAADVSPAAVPPSTTPPPPAVPVAAIAAPVAETAAADAGAPVNGNGNLVTEPSWAPPQLAAPPPSPEPLFAEPAADKPAPVEPAKSTVPGVTLPPPRRGGTAAVLGGVGLLAAVGGLAIYAGLSGSAPTVTTSGGSATQPPTIGAAVLDAARPDDLARVAEAPSDHAAAVAENVAQKPSSAPTPNAPTPNAPTPNAPTGVQGTFAVASTPDGAAVFVDGEPRGTTPAQIDVALGRHSFIVLGEGQKMAQQTVVVAAGGRLDVPLEPAKLPAAVAGSAGLKVRCKSHGELRIFVDGADSGRTCPNEERISVTPGPHKIGLFSARTGEMHESEHEVTEGNNSTRVYVRY
jgi:hypothetical protein